MLPLHLWAHWFFHPLTLSLPHLHDTRRYDRQDKVEPDVGEDAPERGDEEHPQMFDLPALAVGDHPHADPDDHKHVEGSTADDGSWTQLASLEFVTTHLQKVCNRERKDKSTYHLHLNKRYTELLCVCVWVYLYNREQYLWSAGAQSHERQIGHCFIPDSNRHHWRFPVRHSDGHLLLLLAQTHNLCYRAWCK